MSQMRHLFIKDLRRLRWSLVAWCVLVAARTFVDTIGADIAFGGFGAQIAISQLAALLSLTGILFLGFLVSRLVHDEPLVGRDAFWLTRPIAPVALMAAKLAFALVFFIVVPLAGHVVVPAAFGMHARDIASSIPVFLFTQSILVTLLMALAAVTPSFVRYAGAMVGVAAAFVVLTGSMIFLALWMTDAVQEGGDGRLPDPTAAIVGGTMIVLAALAVIGYQYRRRRLSRALAIAVAGAILVFVIPEWWPWSFAPRPQAETAAAPVDTPALVVSLDTAAPRVTDSFVLRRRTAPKKQIAAHATVAGVPPAFDVRAILAGSRLEFPDGTALETHHDKSFAVLSRGFGGYAAAHGTSLEAALGGVRLLTRRTATEDLSSQQWPMLLQVDERDFVRYRAQPGRLTATLDVLFDRAVARGTLPLADGATATIGGARVSIVRVIRRATGCTVLVRRAYVESLFSLPRYRPFLYVLRNRARREAAGGDSMELEQHAAGGFLFGGGVLRTSPAQVAGRGFVLEQYELQFPAVNRPAGSSVDFDDAWLAGAEFVVVETIPAGSISRTIAVEGFRMAP